MGDFSKFFGFNSKFVYYENLKETHPDIYGSLQKDKNYYKDNYNKHLINTGMKLKSFATIEARKEIALLNDYFDVGDLGLTEEDMLSEDSGVKLTQTINTTLQFKDTFERHLTRILGPAGRGKGTAKITGAQFFNTYFQAEMYKVAKETLNKLDKKILKKTPQELGEILFSEENINQAIYNVFFVRLKKSGDWKANDKQGYRELYSAIERFNKNEFLDMVRKAYHLDEVQERLQESFEQKGLKELLKNGKESKKLIRTSLKETTTAKGTLGEILGAKGTEAVINTFKESSGKNFKVTSSVVGAAKGKADFVLTFGFDPTPLLEIIEENQTDRIDTVAAYKAVNEHLKKVKEGFIVYANAKDYSLVKSSKGYSFSGFSSGSDISLGTFEGVVTRRIGKSQRLIGRIMSTMTGAVLEDQQDVIEQDIASKIAYFLFDDVLTIATDSKTSKKSIHLLWLDGIYIPLSYLLLLMSEAMITVAQGGENHIRDIFNVTIDPGKIAFPDGPWEPGDWREQKRIAYSQIEIGATFLKNFAEVVKKLR